MNARMENFIRAIKTECLDKMIITSEKQLRLAVKEYLEYWNHYRRGCINSFERDLEVHLAFEICSVSVYIMLPLAA